MADEMPSTDLITLTRYVMSLSEFKMVHYRLELLWTDRHILADQFRLGAAATGDLTMLLNAIQVTSKFIATNVRKARLINL